MNISKKLYSVILNDRLAKAKATPQAPTQPRKREPSTYIDVTQFMRRQAPIEVYYDAKR